MKVKLVPGLTFLLLLGAAGSIATQGVAAAAVFPGTPLGAGFGPQDIVEGGNLLPGQVQPGDVVLRENPTGGDVRGNRSDVVRFFNVDGMGFGYLISDTGETGVRNIDVNIIDPTGALTTLKT